MRTDIFKPENVKEYGYVPAGMVVLEVGDIIQCDGGEHIITRVNDCRAQATPMSLSHVKVEDKVFGKVSEFDKRGKPQDISTTVERARILERSGQAGLDAFLAKKPRPGRSHLEPGDDLFHAGVRCTVLCVAGKKATVGALDGREWVTDREVNDVVFAMTKPLKGDCRVAPEKRAENLVNFLAARTPPVAGTIGGGINNETKGNTVMAKAVKAAKKKAGGTEEASHGALGGWLGNSVTSVIRSLGKAGVGVAHARAIAKKAGIVVADATVQIQLNAGKNGKSAGKKGKDVTYSSLTATQVKELRDSVVDPDEATKE